MIMLYTGTPGSGKSYAVSKTIVDNLRTGRIVYTNVDGMDDSGCREAIKAMTGMDDYEINKRLVFITPERTVLFFNNVKEGALCVIDECHKYWSSRDWQKEGNKLLHNWASTHRHHGFDVIFITQQPERLDVAVRELAEWTHEFRKVNFMGSSIQLKYVEFIYAGCDTRSHLMKKHIRTYDRKYFRCYQSYISKDIKEKKVSTTVNILKHPVFFIIPIVIFFALYMLFTKSSFATGDVFGGKKMLREADQRQKTFLASSSAKRIPSPAGSLPSSPSVPASTSFQPGPSYPSLPTLSPTPLHGGFIVLPSGQVLPLNMQSVNSQNVQNVPVQSLYSSGSPRPSPANADHDHYQAVLEERNRIERLLPGARSYQSLIQVESRSWVISSGKKVEVTGCTIDEDEKIFSCKKL